MRKKLLIIFVILAHTITAQDFDFKVDGIYYYIISQEDLTCAVTSEVEYNGDYSGDIVIPSTVKYGGNEFTVTRIENFAFAYCSDLMSVIIPNTVTSIGCAAFTDCSSLTTVDIPDSVTSISEQAFLNCSSLSAFTGKFASEDSRCLIIDGALSFFAPAGLTSYDIPNSATSIGRQAFSGCTGLTSVDIPNSVTSIGGLAFYGCTGLTSVDIPNSVTTLGDMAFNICTGLTSVKISNSITKIEWGTFSGCNRLTSVTIPSSVGWIDRFGFGSCTGLKEIISLNVVPPIIYDFTFVNVSLTECVVKVPEESVDLYKSAGYWKDFVNIVGLNSEDVDDPDTKQCAQPTIQLVNGELIATSATEGAQCYISVTSEDMKCVDGEPITLTGVYNVSSYAHAEGYMNSETVTAIVLWVNPKLEDTSIISMETRKAVLILAHNGNIIVSGTERGEYIQLYTIDGLQICNVSADDDQTIIPCDLAKGKIVVVNYGDKSVKIRI